MKKISAVFGILFLAFVAHAQGPAGSIQDVEPAADQINTASPLFFDDFHTGVFSSNWTSPNACVHVVSGHGYNGSGFSMSNSVPCSSSVSTPITLIQTKNFNLAGSEGYLVRLLCVSTSSDFEGSLAVASRDATYGGSFTFFSIGKNWLSFNQYLGSGQSCTELDYAEYPDPFRKSELINLQIRTDSSGLGNIAGTFWIGAVEVDAIQRSVTTWMNYPNYHGYVWTDVAPGTIFCGAGAVAGEICGNSEVNGVFGTPISSDTLKLRVCTNNNCSGGSVLGTKTYASPSSVQPWNLLPSDYGGIPATGTTYYVCGELDLTSNGSTILADPCWSVVFEGATFRSGLMNYFSPTDDSWVHNGKSNMWFYAVDNLSGFRDDNSGHNVFSTGGCNPAQASAKLCYENDLAGPSLSVNPKTQATQSSSNNGGAIKFAALFPYYKSLRLTSVICDIPGCSAANPLAGSDQITPYAQAFADYGLSMLMITAEMNGYVATNTQTAGGPSTTGFTVTPTTGGSISSAFVCVEYAVQDSYSNTGSFPPVSLPSSPIVATMGVNNAVQIVLPSALNKRWENGAFIYTAPSSSSTCPDNTAFTRVLNPDGTTTPVAFGSTITLTALPTGGLPPTEGDTFVLSSSGISASATTGGSIPSGAFVHYLIAERKSDSQTISLPTSDAFVQVSSPNNAIQFTFPACSSSGTGYYVWAISTSSATAPLSATSNKQNASNGYALQQTPGTPIACSGSFTLTSVATNMNMYPMGDRTADNCNPSCPPNGHLPGWQGALTDDVAITDLMTTFGAAGAGIGGVYMQDEPTTSAGRTSTHRILYAHKLGISAANGAFDFVYLNDIYPKFFRSVTDIPFQDPYENAGSIRSFELMVGVSARTATGWGNTVGTGNQLVNLSTPYTIANEDVWIYNMNQLTYGTRPCWPTVWHQSFGNGMAAYPAFWSELGKALVDCQETGNAGTGIGYWQIGTTGGTAKWLICPPGANSYCGFDTVEETNLTTRRFGSLIPIFTLPSLDSTFPASSGFNPPGMGHVLSNITYGSTMTAMCGAASIYTLNPTQFPFGPLGVVTKQDANGNQYLLVNNRCGGDGNPQFTATFTLTAPPTGATNVCALMPMSPEGSLYGGQTCAPITANQFSWNFCTGGVFGTNDNCQEFVVFEIPKPGGVQIASQ